MKVLALTLALVLPALSFATTTTETKSVFTDLEKDCIVVSSATDQAEIDFFTSECKAFGGFTLRESGGDLRYGPELSFAGTDIDLRRPTAFHDMASRNIEWVYDITRDEAGLGDIKYKALIYQLSIAYPEGDKDDYTKFYVVRLNGADSCVVGIVERDADARKLANDVSAQCLLSQK